MRAGQRNSKHAPPTWNVEQRSRILRSRSSLARRHAARFASPLLFSRPALLSPDIAPFSRLHPWHGSLDREHAQRSRAVLVNVHPTSPSSSAAAVLLSPRSPSSADILPLEPSTVVDTTRSDLSNEPSRHLSIHAHASVRLTGEMT